MHPTPVTSVLLLLALLAGAAITTQAGVNTQLRVVIGDPVWATLISFMVGLLALAVYVVAARQPLPELDSLRGAPLYVWFGGVLGALFVMATIVLAPRLGPALLFGFVVAGQMLAALGLEQFGLLGFPVHHVSVGRLVGVACLVAGVVLIRRS